MAATPHDDGSTAVEQDPGVPQVDQLDRRTALGHLVAGLAAGLASAGASWAASATSQPAVSGTADASARPRRELHLRLSVEPAFVTGFLQAPAYPLKVYEGAWDGPKGPNPHPRAGDTNAALARVWTGITQFDMSVPSAEAIQVRWTDGKVVAEAEAQGRLKWEVWHRFQFPARTDWHLTQEGYVRYTAWPTLGLTFSFDQEARALVPRIAVEKLRWRPGLLARYISRQDLETVIKEHLGRLDIPLSLVVNVPVPTASGEPQLVTVQVADAKPVTSPEGLHLDVTLAFGWKTGP